MTFKTAGEIAREEHDWGTFAAVSSPADGAERIMTVEATFLPGSRMHSTGTRTRKR